MMKEPVILCLEQFSPCWQSALPISTNLLFQEGGGVPGFHKNKIITTNTIEETEELMVVRFSITNIQFSLPPWLHLEPVFLPEAEEPVVPLSYWDLHKIPVFPGKEAGTHLYPLLQSQGTPGRAYDHHLAIHILIPLADK